MTGDSEKLKEKNKGEIYELVRIPLDDVEKLYPRDSYIC